MRLGIYLSSILLGTSFLIASTSLFAQGQTCIIWNSIRYPEQAIANGIQGTVQVELVRDTNCLITSKRVLKGLGYGLDEEAVKLVNTKAELCLMRGKRYCADTLMIPIRFAIPQ